MNLFKFKQLLALLFCVFMNKSVFGQCVNYTQPANNSSNLSCILMKSIAYGIQQAVKEYSLLQNDSNLSKAIETAEISHYLRNFCPENTKNPSKELKESNSNPAKKVKRNQHSLPAEKSATPSNSTLNNNNTNKNNTKKAEEPAKQQNNEFARFLRSFTELTDILKSQISKDKEKHVQHQQTPILTENSSGKVEIYGNKTGNTNKTEESQANQKGRHHHSHKKHKHNKSKTEKNNKVEEKFPVDPEDNLNDDRNIVERFKQEEKQSKAELSNKQQEKQKDNENINQNNEKYIYLVPKTRNKRSIPNSLKTKGKEIKVGKKPNNKKNKLNKKVKNIKKQNK